MSNPIKGSDLYQDDGAIDKGIKDLEKLKEAYTAILDAIGKEAEGLIGKLKEVNTTTKEGQSTAKQAATDADKLKKTQKDYASALNETNTKIRELRDAKREDIREQKLQNKFAREAEGSYNKLSAQYALNKLQLNKMSAAERSATESGRKLEKQTKEIYEEMSRLQKATGKHTLEVGNYGIATENLHPILGTLNSRLGALGTSLTDLGKADKPFKSLTTAVMNFGKATLAFVLSPVGLALTVLGALFFLIKNNKDTVLEFNDSLINVGKTTGITGEALRDLGQDIVGLSQKLKTIGTPALFEYAVVAGQLGIKGSENILRFTEALAKLEQASDIKGEEGAASIARLLTLTDGGVQNIADFGDEIVILGNNFAATENEILGNATAIAQNTAQYAFGRRSVLAYATATKAVGIEAQLTGSTIGRTLGIMEHAIRTGQNIDAIAKLTGQSVEDLKRNFKEDSAGVFNDFVKGLNNINEAGGSVNGALEQLGITSVRDKAVIATLATKGFDTLTGSIEKTGMAAGSLDAEFDAASKKLKSQWARVGIAWDNLVLSIEDGEGVFGKVGAFLAGAFADYLDHVSFTIKLVGAAFRGLGAVAMEVIEIAKDFITSLKGLGDIKIDFKDPLGSLKSFKDAFSDVSDAASYSKAGKRLAGAFGDAFKEEMVRATEATNVALAGASADALDSGVKQGMKSLGELGDEISALQEKLKGATNREEAKIIQDQIKVLESKRDAILGVAKANLKEIQSREENVQKAEADVMQDGEGKDLAMLEIELNVKRKLFEKYNLDVSKVEEYGRLKRLEIAKKYADLEEAEAKKVADAKLALLKKEEDEKKSAFSGGMAVINAQTDLAMSEIDLLKTTEAEKTRLRLEAEKDRLKKVIALNKSIGGQLTDVQVQTMQNTIDKIDQEIKQAGKDQQDIYSMVGLKLDDEQKAAIEESLQFALDNVRAFMDARVQAAEVAVQAAQEETAASQSRYQAEIDARNNGYASNVLEAQRELELNKKKEAAALKEKEKAQKAQEKIDTAMQVSGLITASVNIWKSLSAIPIVGTALAVAAVGVMWASYAASKIKAKSAAKEKYGDGGLEFLDGGSHSSGNDIPIGTTRSGKQRTAEGGEAMAIINKRQTRKYKGILPNIIDSLNKGTFERTYSNAFISNEEMPPLYNIGYDSPDLKQLEGDLEAIRKRGEIQRYTDSDGNLVEVYKNVKRVFKR